MLFLGDRSKILFQKKAFNSELTGIVSNPQSEFMSYLYLFGVDVDEKNPKYPQLSIKQFDRDLKGKTFLVSRKEKSARNKRIREVSFFRQNEYEYFSILYEDRVVRVVGFARERFGNSLILDESMQIEKNEISRVAIRKVHSKLSLVELFFLSEDSVCSINLSKNGHPRPMVIKKNVQEFYLHATWTTKARKDKEVLFFPFRLTDNRKEENFLCRLDLSTKKENFYELPGKCWDLRLLKHFIVATAKGSIGTKNEHDEVKVIDPVNKYVAYRFVPSHFRIRQVWVDHSELLILSEQRQGVERLLCLGEMDDNDKIDKFMKKNCLRLAYKFASNSGFKSKFLAQLSRVSGDKELEKAKFEEAMHHYKNTIGFLEPSYVLQKFIEKGQVAYNIDYLVALHDRGRADKYHIKLLVNCLLEKKKFEELKKWFTELKAKESEFAVLAIEACLEYGETDLAKKLAQESKQTNFYVQIVIDNFLTCQDQKNKEETRKEATEILDHIRGMTNKKSETEDWEIRKKQILLYGPVLMQYDSVGVLNLVEEYLTFKLNASSALEEKIKRGSMMAELSLNSDSLTLGLIKDINQYQGTPSDLKDILFLYRRFDEKSESQTEVLIKFLSKNLKNFRNQDKAVISEFIIEFYANKYGKLIREIKRSMAHKKKRRSSDTQFRAPSRRNPTRLEDMDLTNFVNTSDPLEIQRELVQNSENLGKNQPKTAIGNMSSPMLGMDMNDLSMYDDNEDKQFDFLSYVTLDEETRKRLAHCEAQVREQLDAPEVNRLVDLQYLLILFAQCQMRQAKLKVYDLLKLKKEKLRDLFLNSEYQECMDYCQKNFQDCGQCLFLCFLCNLKVILRIELGLFDFNLRKCEGDRVGTAEQFYFGIAEQLGAVFG